MKKYRPPQEAIYEEASQFERSHLGSMHLLSDRDPNDSKISKGFHLSNADVENNDQMAMSVVAGATSSINWNDKLGRFEEVFINDTN